MISGDGQTSCQRQAGWWHVWRGVHHTTHWSYWALQVCTAHVLLEVATQLPQKFSANPWCVKCCFLWQTKQRRLAPDLFLLKSTDYESHRLGHFRNPSHPSSHSSTLIQTEWIIPTGMNEQWTSGNPLLGESAILGQSFVVFDNKVTTWFSTFIYEGKCRLGISFGKLLVLMWYCF